MAKSKSDSAAKSRAELKTLRRQLKQAEREAKRWKDKATKLEKARADAAAQVTKLTKQRDKARRRLDKQSAEPLAAAAESFAASDPEEADTATASAGASVPDESWTVVELRTEARSRGLAGYSGKSKAELLDMLA